ncbi:MAG: CDP-glycerol glycerophosphotransferase family protein [Alkalimonas sp.]|nr:CDP-glycerol glycerophosphotransferase family protein [Alkalimonas sp.]
MNTAEQSPVYIAPANPAGRALAQQLSSQGYLIAGMADNLKQADDIINCASDAQPNARIVVVQGSYTCAVAEGLKKRGFGSKQLFYVTQQNELKRYHQPLAFKLRKTAVWLLTQSFALLRTIVPTTDYLYYAEEFFDSNVLLSYREHRRQYPNEPWLLGRKLKQQISELESDNHHLDGLSLRSLWRCLRAKKLIVDHEYTGETFSLLRRFIPVIQLWHGLPYKALSGNTHYPHICDEAFISSSEWFNQHIFPNIFRAKHYLALGYPRNDAFLQTAEQRDWINTEPLSVLREVQNTTGDLIVYAPTYRDWGDNDYPLDLAELNQWCAEQRVSFLLKFHPFISRKLSDAMGLANHNNLQQLPGLPHIYLYPSGKNVYPWLAEAKALVTDYSSIAYDFLLSGKPILYFQYDIVKYRFLRGKNLVPDKDFIAGVVAQNHTELMNFMMELIVDRSHKPKNQMKIEKKFYTTPTLASKAIINFLR